VPPCAVAANKGIATSLNRLWQTRARLTRVNWEQIETRVGCCTMVNRTIAALIGILITVTSFAPNEAYARSAGGGAAMVHGAVGLRSVGRSINRGMGPGLGWSRFSANRARIFALRRGLRLRRSWYGGGWLDNCLWYGGCYELPGAAEPYDNYATPSGPPPAVIVLRPPCRYMVPSEDGGERNVKVIRCLPVDSFPLPGLRSTSVRTVAGDEEAVR
jgi:hypothetical protein